MSNGVQIDENQFKHMSEKDQNLVLYRNIIRLDKKISRNRKKDTAITAGTGFIGGLFAVIGKGFLK